MLKMIDIPPVWTAALAVVAYVLAVFVPLAVLSSVILTLLAVLSVCLGFALVLYSALWFIRKKTPIEPRKTPKTLLVQGPYRINRNPIYTGLALILTGFCLWLGALSSLLCIPLFVWVITSRFVHGEEATLRAAFGPEAEAYMARTRRW